MITPIGVFLSIRAKCEVSLFSVDPHQANLQPNLLLLDSRLHFISIPTFLQVAFDRTLSFSKHVSSLKASFSHVSRSYAVSLLPQEDPRRSPSLFCIDLFFSLFSHTLHPMDSILKRYQFHQIRTPPPSGQSRHHRQSFVLLYPTSSLRGFSTSPMSHPDSFHSFIL